MSLPWDRNEYPYGRVDGKIFCPGGREKGNSGKESLEVHLRAVLWDGVEEIRWMTRK